MSNPNATAWSPTSPGSATSVPSFEEDAPPVDTGAGVAVAGNSVKANLSEKEEAAQIVAKAQQDLADRKKDAAKVSKGMSKEELQALINSKTKR